MYKSFLTVFSFIFVLFFAQESTAPGETSYNKAVNASLPPLYPRELKKITSHASQHKQHHTRYIPNHYYLSMLYTGTIHEALFHQTACLCKTIPCTNTLCSNKKSVAPTARQGAARK